MIARGGIRDERAERALVGRRLRLVAVLMCAAVLGLAGRFGYLQLAQSETFAARADSNRVRLQAVAPNRGLILDRNGRVLAENRAAYRLVLVPERTPDVDGTLAEIDALVGLDAEERRRFNEHHARSRAFQPVTVKSNLDADQVARLAIHRHLLDGVDVEPYLTRHYPHGALLAHVLGYVGRLDTDDLRTLDADNYRASTHTGKTGIERHYEAVLHGRSGVERVETNAQGRVIRVLERTAPVPGEDVQLSLDLELQREAVAAMGLHAGAVVAMDIASGEVLALVSQPGFDPNLFVHGISRTDYRRLLSSPHRPLFNRFLSGGYEPGSTVKPFLALAGLEAGLITPETRVFSSGEFRLPGHSRRYRDWRAGGHGWVVLESALEESVNTYFYQLAVDLGIDRISRELALFGFGQPTGLDVPGEQTGVLPSRSWKRQALGQAWFPGETVITGIGQGFIVVTPLQLAWATAALAGHGIAAPPRLAVESEPVRVVRHDPAHFEAVIRGLEAVVHGERGTARVLADQVPVRVAGKTGTSQVFGRAQDEPERDTEELPEFLRNHALFTAFAPADAPRIAVAVVVEHGGGGARVAAPVAGRVLQHALEQGW